MIQRCCRWHPWFLSEILPHLLEGDLHNSKTATHMPLRVLKIRRIILKPRSQRETFDAQL